MSLSKYSGDNLAEDFIKPSVWRKTFRFLSIMELVILRQVSSTFKDEVDYLFTTQDKLGIFHPTEDAVDRSMCDDLHYYVPNSSWIRLTKRLRQQHLLTLKSLFPSVKVLVMNSSEKKLLIEDILDSFVDLESLAIDDEIECRDTNRSYPKLKHLFLKSVSGAKLPSLPSLESLRINCNDFSKLKLWMEKNFGRPSKRCEIDYSYAGNPDYSMQCFSSLPAKPKRVIIRRRD